MSQHIPAMPDRSSWILPAIPAAQSKAHSLRTTPALLDEIVRVATQGPWLPTQESLARHEQLSTPAWFGRDKFGIFTHWGLYTVPEFANEWYSRNLYIQGTDEFKHQIDTFGAHAEHGYQSFIPLFTAQKFNAHEWLDAFADAGARYYFPVAEHHDGFQMYASRLSHFNTVEMGPKRDIIGELREATLDHGMHFATSSHRAEHWWFMSHGMEFDSDIRREAEANTNTERGGNLDGFEYRGLKHGSFYWPAMPEPASHMDMQSKPYPSDEYLQDWLMRTCEIIDSYQPEMLYFDWWIGHEAFKPYVMLMAAYYYNRAAQWGRDVSICYKENALPWGAGMMDVERGGYNQAMPFHWQTDTSIAYNSWDYTSTLEYKPAGEIVRTLINVTSHNGNLLLNVGPRADGSLAQKDRDILHTIGSWMKVNGEAIYDTVAWKESDEGPTPAHSGSFNEAAIDYTTADIRFTSRVGIVYASVLAPAGGEGAEHLHRSVLPEIITVKAYREYRDEDHSPFHGVMRRVSILGDPQNADLPFTRDSEGLHIQVGDALARMRAAGTLITSDEDVLPVVLRLEEK